MNSIKSVPKKDFYQGSEYNGEGLLPPEFIEADEKGKGKMLESLIGKLNFKKPITQKSIQSGFLLK